MGALTLEMLACYRPPVPFASQYMIGTESLCQHPSLLTELTNRVPG